MQKVKSFSLYPGEDLKAKSDSGSGSVTFRFDNKILNQLRKEAKQKRISLNTLASQIFNAHTEYNAYAPKAGMVSFPKSLLIRLMDGLSEEQVDRLSEYIARNDIKDLALLMRSKYTLNSFLDMVEAWLRVSGFPYTREVSEDYKTHSFIIQHDMGKRWSIYFERLFRYVFEDLKIVKRPYFEITDNSVVFNVHLD